VLKPYKKTLDRWLWPDVFRRQDTSVSQAKRAISDYKKGVGNPEGLAEFVVFYCESSAGFSSDIASDDEGYLQRRYLLLRDGRVRPVSGAVLLRLGLRDSSTL
jgi:hypothetical protein